MTFVNEYYKKKFMDEGTKLKRRVNLTYKAIITLSCIIFVLAIINLIFAIINNNTHSTMGWFCVIMLLIGYLIKSLK